MRILVIDDDQAVLETICLMLISEGHTVLAVARGREALRKLEAGEQVDLVLTDLSMPDMTGWDIVRVVRARWPALRVGILSGANPSPSAQHERLDLILHKPVGLLELRAALHQLEGKTGCGGAG